MNQFTLCQQNRRHVTAVTVPKFGDVEGFGAQVDPHSLSGTRGTLEEIRA